MRLYTLSRINHTSVVLAVIATVFLFYAYSSGITGRTLPNGEGCSCHDFNAAVTATITGPATLEPSQTGVYKLTITGGPLDAAGCNIAASGGTLIEGDGLQLIDGELTHTSPKTPVDGKVEFTFSYTAPAEIGDVTLNANGNSVNLSGGNDGDAWNYAPSFTINVAVPLPELQLTVLYEGLYSPASDTTITDSVSVFLKSAGGSFASIDSVMTKLDNLGQCQVSFSSANKTDSYYLVIRNRNSIETWSRLPIQFTNKVLVYDFTSDSSSAYGNNLKKIGSKWCVYTGDIDLNGFIDNNDLLLVDNDAFNFAGGYLITDLDGNQFVDNNDLLICDNNAFNFVGKTSPESKPVRARKQSGAGINKLN